MAGDINTYALSIEFGLADKFTPTLDLADERLTRIEEQVNTIAAKGMVQFQQVASQLETSISQIALQYVKINDLNTQLLKPAKEQQNFGLLHQRRLMDETALIKDKMFTQWLEINKLLGIKQKLLDEESRTLEKENGEVQRIGKNLGFWADQINKANQAMQSYLRSLVDVVGHINMAMDASEKFHHANLRLIGTQSQMAQSAQELAMHHGLFREQVLEAYQALGDAKVPLEALDKLAVATTQFSRLSGIGVHETANWQKALLAAGASAAEVERRTTQLAISMRRFGIDSQDANRLMGDQEARSVTLLNRFGQLGQVLMQAQLSAAAFAKELNGTRAQVAEISDAWTHLTNVDLLRIRAASQHLGVQRDINSVEGQLEFQTRAALELARRRLDIEERIRQGTGSHLELELLGVQATAQYGEAMGKSVNTLSSLLAIKMRAGATEQELLGRSLAAARMQGDSQENLTDIYNESNNTLRAQLNLTKSAFTSFFGSLFSMIEPGLIVVMKAINTVVKALAEFITWVNDGLTALGPFGTAIKVAIGIIIALVVAFVAFNVITAAFGGAAGFATRAGAAMGAMLEATLKGLGRGLQALSSSIPAMLALSALMLSVGIAAYLLALAVVMIAQQGLAGVKALAALTVAIIALAIGLAVAGLIAGSVWPALLALAVVLLAAGAAAYLFAAAVTLIAGLGSRAIGVLLMLAVGLVLVGVAMAAMGAMVMPVIPGVIAIAVAILLFAVAALLLAVALYIVVQSLQLLNADLGKNVAAFAWEIMKAAPILILGGALLIIGAAILLVGAVILLVAAAVMLVASLLFVVAAAVIFAGGGLLVGGATFLAIGAALLAVGVVLLAIGAALLIPASIVLIVAAILLLIGAAILLPGAALIATAGIMIMVGGVGLYVGALALKAGIPILAEAVSGLFWTGIKLAINAAFLIPAAVILMAVGAMVMAGGLALFLGALFLLIGATLLLVGATFIGLAGALIAIGAAALLVGAVILVPAAATLISAGILILIAGAIALPGAAILMVVGVMIMIGGLGVLLGALGLYLGTKMLLTGATLLIRAAILLHAGGLILIPTAAILGVGAASLIVAAALVLAAGALLLIGSAMLLVGALLFTVAMFVLEPGADLLIEIGPGLLESSLMLMVSGYMIMVGATFMLIGGTLLLAAAAILAVAGPVLWAASWATAAGLRGMRSSAELAFELGGKFLAGGMGFFTGGTTLLASAELLGRAGSQLRTVGVQLAESLATMREAALLAAMVGSPIHEAGLSLTFGGIWLLIGSILLGMAARELSWPALSLMWSAVFLRQAALNFLAAGNDIATSNPLLTDGLRQLMAVVGLMVDLPERIRGLGWSMVFGSYYLRVGAEQLAMAASLLREPAAELAGIAAVIIPVLQGLAQALRIPIDRLFLSFVTEAQVAAQTLYTALDSVVFTLNIYALRLEMVANRIALAFRRAAPTLGMGGLALMLRAEPITTTPTVDRVRQADEESARQEYLREIRRHTGRLTEIRDKLEQIRTAIGGGVVGPGAPLTEIVELLRVHLPEIASAAGGGGSPGLQANMTDWMGG